MRSKSLLKTSGISLLLITGLVMKVGCDSGVGFLGLQDYQRDLIVGGLAAALLANQANAPADAGAGQPIPVEGEQGPQGVAGETGADGTQGTPGAQGPIGPEGSAGAVGPQGPEGEQGPIGDRGRPGSNVAGDPGPNYFGIFIDDFFMIEGGPTGALPIEYVEIVEPVLGAPTAGGGVAGGAIAFRVSIPQIYDEGPPGNDVTMRLYLYRTGGFNGRCYVMSVIAKRLSNGSDVADYGEIRYVRIRYEDFVVGDEPAAGFLVVVDLPVNVAIDEELDLPALHVGETLAFELATHEGMGDRGRYQMLGVEFFESANGTAAVDGAEVFHEVDAITCVAP